MQTRKFKAFFKFLQKFTFLHEKAVNTVENVKITAVNLIVSCRYCTDLFCKCKVNSSNFMALPINVIFTDLKGFYF